MPNEQRTPQTVRIEQHAIERDLVAQLSPDKGTQKKANAKAAKLRELLNRVRARDGKE